MALAPTAAPSPRQPLRLWPGVVLVVLQWLLRYGVPVVAPDALRIAVIGGFGGALLLLLWWLFFSRAPWSERLGALLLMAVGLFATSRLAHESLPMGMLLFMMPAIPVLCLALVAWAAATRRLAAAPRRAALVATILAACGIWTLFRTGGVTGNFANDLHWRWSETPEERLLAQAAGEPAAPTGPTGPTAPTANPTGTPGEPLPGPAGTEPAAPTSAPAAADPLGEQPQTPVQPPAAAEPAVLPAAPAQAATGADWPGFRGPRRDGILPGVRIAADWSVSPPVELWRRPVGPGWSSFAVRGGLVYTQEQRGEDEIVSCYRLATGEPVWMHRDAARFWESAGGAGPRGTPTLHEGRVYALGATGILNALDAGTGAVAWSRNAAADTGAKLPGWGFAGSPLVVDDLVVVATAGRLVAYGLATGKPRWFGPEGGGSYSSPQLVTLDGVPQILLLKGAGAVSVAPADGTVLWEHKWPGDGIVQPALTADGGVLLGTGSGMGAEPGVARLAVGRGPGGWTVQERWTSKGLKPYFNDFVVHEGHAYGFDGTRLSCIDLANGHRKWKDGHYGHGQLILLPDQDLLLVLSEQGELALVRAVLDGFTEVARRPAIAGKTWNHPVLAGDVLLVRNAEEMVAFRLARAGG
jgi:outer membrane protein assembly factor BamB